MIIKKIDEVPAQPVRMEGAKDVLVRVVYGPNDGAPTFAMRVFELAPGGYTPFHDHGFEHEVLILEGPITLMTPEGPKPLQSGDTALVLPGETHQFKNLSTQKRTRFLCLVPVEYQK